MNIIERSYELRLYCLSADRIFTDEFLLSLSYCIEDDKEEEMYLDILNTEFRGEIPQKFLEELLKWVKVEFIEQ